MNTSNFKAAKQELTNLNKTIKNDFKMLKYEIKEGRTNQEQVISSFALNVGYNVLIVSEQYDLTDFETSRLDDIANLHSKKLERIFVA